MKLFKTILFLAITIKYILNNNSTNISEEDGLFLINDYNYDEFIEKNPTSLIFFYFHPCMVCKQILPELKKTSEIIGDLEKPVRIATVNCTENAQIKRRLHVNGLSMRFIMDGRPMNYTGGRTSEEIITWVKKMVGPSIGEVKSVKDVEELRKYVPVMIAFFGDDEFLFNTFKDVARNHPNLIFIRCRKIECLDYYNVDNGNLILFKKYDEGRNDFKRNDYSEEELNEFIEDHSKPTVMNFDFRTANLIFEKNNPGLFLYLSKNSPHSVKFNQIFNDLGRLLKGKLYTVITDIVDIPEEKLADMVGVKSDDLPLVMIHDTRENLKTYKMNKSIDITQENILKFVEEWENNKLVRHIKSQQEPVNQTDPSYILVGNTLEYVAMDNTKDVLVLFYAPWCKHSKELMPIYENLAKKLKSSAKNLLITKFDAYYNEPSIFNLSYYPTIILWRAENKNEYIEFKSDRTEESLLKFVKLHATFPIEDGDLKEFKDL